MSTTAATIHMVSDWHRLGAGLSVRFALQAGALEVEWSPRLPTQREAKRLMDAYRLARHQFLAELAQRLGANIACVEV
jgi:hypothetical protein